VAVSLPAMAPALVLGPAGVVARSGAAGLSSGATEYGSVMADVLQDKGVNMLDANAISKALSNPKIIAEMRDKAAKRGLIIGVIDGLSLGVAGRFLKPAQALIAEGKLAGTAAKKATLSAWGKELATILPNVEPGQTIAAIYIPKQGTTFFYEGKKISQIQGADFAKAFFGIWLDTKTSAPKLRTDLLGQGCPPPLISGAC